MTIAIPIFKTRPADFAEKVFFAGNFLSKIM